MTDEEAPKVNISLLTSTSDGRRFALHGIPDEVFFRTYRIIDEHGVQAAIEIGTMGANVILRRQLEEAETERIKITFEGIASLKTEEKWETDEDPLLSCSYHLLYRRQITRDQAAAIAGRVLGKEIDTDAWRMRVNRWAAVRKLPKIKRTKPTE